MKPLKDTILPAVVTDRVQRLRRFTKGILRTPEGDTNQKLRDIVTEAWPLIKKLRRIWLMYKKGLFEHNLQARYEEVGYALHSLGQPDNYTFQLYSDTLWRSKVALFETRIYNWTECPLRQSLMNPVLEIQLDRPIPRVPNFDNNPVLPI